METVVWLASCIGRVGAAYRPRRRLRVPVQTWAAVAVLEVGYSRVLADEVQDSRRSARPGTLEAHHQGACRQH
jgi:hypothetical protein